MFLLAISINKGVTTYYDIEPEKYYDFLIYPVTNSIRQFAHTCSIYMIVGLTLERYWSYCHPEKALRFCTRTKAKILIGFVTTFSFMFCTSVFWEHKWNRVNGTVVAVQSDLRRDEDYKNIHRGWLHFVVRFAIPTVCLVIFNFLIIREVNIREFSEFLHQSSWLGHFTCSE